MSTRNLAPLPDIRALKRLTQSLAILDAILWPEWVERYYSFNSHWSENEMMASMRNGSGDEWFLLFSQAGAVMKGFSHESPMAVIPTWPGVLSDVPAVFSTFLCEPAFSMNDTTFCLWQTVSESQWQRGCVTYPSGSDPDGSADLLFILDGNPKTYQQWAEEYSEREISLTAVDHVYAHLPLTEDIVAELNSDIVLSDMSADIMEIGYPS
ncbi:MAG: hypothetical protein HC936_08435 [Leptolyngbyaceae cyanobacterium SU_3_3]|nr:hypothetical protein [Leptolyngbyaceae cyanobacterium SU_3_3]